jgi:5-aminolevulinate synthase
MGKALAVQSTRHANPALAGGYGGMRSYHRKAEKADRAKFHSAAIKEAQAVDVGVLRQEPGTTSMDTCCTNKC